MAAALECHESANNKVHCIRNEDFIALQSHVAVHDKEIGSIATELGTLNRAIGRAPDPLASNDSERHGSGLLGITHKLANAMQQQRPAFASFSESEGEITSVQDRSELLARAKAAEAALRQADEQKRWRWGLIVPIVVAVVAVLGNVLQAVLR